jgi:methyl-accepting chemotaxis protein
LVVNKTKDFKLLHCASYAEEDIEFSKRPELDRWILSELNSLIKDVDDAFADITVGLNSLGDGDFGARITKDYSGDYDKMKQSVNSLAANLNGVITELSSVMKYLSSGEDHGKENQDSMGPQRHWA